MTRSTKTIFYITALSITITSLSQEETKKLLSQLYQERAGYGIDPQEEKLVLEKGASPTYGEITPEGVDILAQELNLTPNDVFYDLGCGVGKMVLQIHLETPVRKSVGVELAPTRIRHAQKVHATLKQQQRLPAGKELQFREEDMLNTNIDDATVIYVSSTCFSNKFMEQLINKLAKLKPGLRLITLTHLPSNDYFEHTKELAIPMTWSSNTTAYIHTLKDSPSIPRNTGTQEQHP